jgi:hypothetical protein
MRTALFLCALAAFISASAAAADGGPSPGWSWDGNGVAAHAGKVRYVALASGRTTLVEAVRVRGGRVVRWGTVRGSYGIPAVTVNGSAGGLSHDGKTLVLSTWPGIPSRYSQTSFSFLETRNFRLRQVVRLRGSFSYDALSPDASVLYLIQYTASSNYNRYRVRAYDLRARRLLPGAIVDKTEPKEAMTGAPIDRVESADGRWAYTFYARTGKPPFVHALDTVARTAACLDVRWRGTQQAQYQAHINLSSDSRMLIVHGAGRTMEVALPS